VAGDDAHRLRQNEELPIFRQRSDDNVHQAVCQHLVAKLPEPLSRNATLACLAKAVAGCTCGVDVSLRLSCVKVQQVAKASGTPPAQELGTASAATADHSGMDATARLLTGLRRVSLIKQPR
jgi:hypothetical protein